MVHKSKLKNRAFMIRLRISKTESCLNKRICFGTLGKYNQNKNFCLKSLQFQIPCERKTYCRIET